MTDLQSLIAPPVRNASQNELNALVALYSQGRMEQARGLAARLTAGYPHCEITHNIAGVIAAAAGARDEAVALYDRAIAIAPDYAEAFVNRGNALKELGRLDDALTSFDAALALAPGYAGAHLNRAIVLRMQGRLGEALAANDAAIRHNPQLAQAYSNRGNVLQELNRFAEALADHERALLLDPRFAQAHVNRGNVLRNLDRLDEAVACYDQAIALKPAFAMAHRNRGAVLKLLKRFDAALASFEAAFAHAPEDATALSEALSLEAQMCLWGDPARQDDLLARVRGGVAIPPFHLLALADDPVLQLANARRWTAPHSTQAPAAPVFAPRNSGDRIRIGYFSADFHNHATMALMIGMLEHHDRAAFEIHAFSYGPQVDDAMRARTIAAVDAFHDIASLSDEAGATLARQVGIDIAVDLKGFTENGRPGLFACRAAPRQVSYLGYPGTTGSAQIDYVIADRVIVPEDREAHYSETVLALPGSYQINDSARPIAPQAPTRSELGLPESGFVFASLNNSYKITPAEFAIWMRLLRRVEGSVLWLLEDNAWAAVNLRREAEARGVAPERLVFAPRVPVAEHIARQARADLFLDTFTVNAHTTASEALWAGLPVLTRLGESFAARVAASLLHAVGLPELVTDSAEAYEALAGDLAADPARLAAIRAKLEEGRDTAPLFDTAEFTRGIEALYAGLMA